MANAKTKKSGPSWIWRHKLLSLIGLLIIAAGAYAAYNHIQTSNNKRDFQQARAAIDSVYDDAIRNVGKPDNAEEKSSCTRPNQEFTQGVLTCDVNVKFVYGLESESQANDYYIKIQKLIGKHNFRPSKELGTSVKDSLVIDTTYHSSHDYYTNSGLGCEASYIYDTPSQTDLAIKSNKHPLEVLLSCSGKAKQQYYRLSS
jgi:hypothetical protein